MIRAMKFATGTSANDNARPTPSPGTGFWRDAWWQLCCDFILREPPRFIIENTLQNDPVHLLLEKTWVVQQIPLALVLYALGDWTWVLWGICLRVFVSLSGH